MIRKKVSSFKTKKNYLRFLKKQENNNEIFQDKLGQLKNFYTPICNSIYKWHKLNQKVLVVGLSGGQGSGKTTIAQIIKIILRSEFKLNVINSTIKTNNNQICNAPHIIIAGGVGSFEPRKISLQDAEKHDGKSIFYSINDKNKFKDKKVVIFGGGDSALDWTLELSKISKVTLVHRRDEFRGAPHTLNEIKKLEKAGKVALKTRYQISSIEGEKNIKSITIKNDEDKSIKIDTDYVLGFFGLVMQLGPIAEWGLNMNKKTISVNTENFQTNKKGIFAIGDICTYPGKEKLILSGFHEAALASVECFKRARPNEKYRFQFTTSSKEIQERLGQKPK